jgi:hypothetical protein
MATLSNAGILTTGLTFAYDMANSRSFLGQPATNLYGQNLGNVNAIANWDKPTAGTATITDSVATSYGTFNGNRIWLVTVSAGTVNSYSSWRNCLPAGYDATYGTTRRLNFKVCMLKGSISSLSSHNGGGNSGYNAANWTAIDPSTVKDCEQKSGWYQFDADVSGSYPSGQCVGLAILSGDLQFLVTEMQVTNTSFRVPFTPFSRSNTQSIVDLTGNYLLTPTNLSYASNNTFSFTGSSYIDLNSSNIITGTNPFTVESWYTTTGATADEIFGNYGSSSTTNTLWISGRYGVYINSSVYFPGAPIGAGTYHIAVTRDSSGNIVLYRNGVQQNSGVLSASISVTYPFRIGADVNGAAEPFTGSIHSVRVCNQRLTAAQVTQNFNAQRSRYGV